MRKKIYCSIALATVLASCSKEDVVSVNNSLGTEDNNVPSIEITLPDDGMGVISRSAGITGNEGRWLNSSEAKHSIDCVKILVVKALPDVEGDDIVADTLITDWMTSNGVEDYESLVSGHGRRLTFPLTGSNKLDWNADNYTVYAFGYSSNSTYKVNNKSLSEYMASLGNGKKWNGTNVVDVPEETISKFRASIPIMSEEGKDVKEIFAGSSILNKNNPCSLFLNRIVGGIYSYLKDIPYVIDANKKPGNCLSLVISERNHKISLQSFNRFQPSENGTGSVLSYVVNGAQNKGEDLSGGKVLYDINLEDWFTSIIDENNDGYIDVTSYKNVSGDIKPDGEKPKNWKKSEDERFSGSQLIEGTVFGGNFVIPFDNLDDANFSIKLVLSRKEKGKSGVERTPLREWQIMLPSSKVDKMNKASLWFFWNEEEGVFKGLDPENRKAVTSSKYAVVRNQLYNIGFKPTENDTNDDKPISLRKDAVEASVNDNWYDFNDMEVGE